jgi:Flp pilus assembly secretin CpaC
MKKLFSVCTLCLAAFVCSAAPAVQQLNYVAGSLNVLELPFRVHTCRVSDPSIAAVEVIDNNSKLRIVGLRKGMTDIQVAGENIFRTYRISIVSNLYQDLNNIIADLESIPEVDASISGNKIILKGEISNIIHWQMFRKLVPFYEGKVVNLVTFQPKAEVMVLLQRAFNKAGYTLVRENRELKHGEIMVVPAGDVVNITGTVYSQEDIKRIEKIINAQSWLTTQSNASNKVQAVMNVDIVPEMLEIGAVFVGMEKSQLESIGNNFMKNGIPINVSANYNGGLNRNMSLVRGGGSYGISSSLGTVIKFLGENTNSVFRHAGFLTFKSNDTPQFREIHNGGTLKVRVSGDNNGSLEDVDYGFILKIKGGLTGKDRVYMEIEVSLSTPVLLENGDYDIKEKSIKTSAFCKLDETIALGGIKELLDNSTGPNGVPFLRNVPIISWFVAEKNDTYHDKQGLVLISPRLMSQAKPIEIPPAQELRDVEESAQIQIREGQREQRRWYEFLRW